MGMVLCNYLSNYGTLLLTILNAGCCLWEKLYCNHPVYYINCSVILADASKSLKNVFNLVLLFYTSRAFKLTYNNFFTICISNCVEVPMLIKSRKCIKKILLKYVILDISLSQAKWTFYQLS